LSGAVVAPRPLNAVEQEPQAPAESSEPTPLATAARGASAPVVLDVRNLVTYFYTYDGVVRALEGVSFKLRRGETLGMVGETGCGKSVSMFSVTRLIPDPPGRVVSGKILYRGADLLWGLKDEAKFIPIKNTGRVKVKRSFRRVKAALARVGSIRGGGIAMIFQEPSQAMNPIFTIADQVSEVILEHRGVEVIDGLLNAKPDPAVIREKADALRDALAAGNDPLARSTAKDLGTAVGVPSFGTQAYYLGRQAKMMGRENLGEQLVKASSRLRPKGSQRGFLVTERALSESARELRATYLSEMRKGEYERTRRSVIAARRFRTRVRGAPYRIWGVKRGTGKPLREEAFWRVVRALEGVQIANPVQVARGYPHELSGGMLQRVMIAMALIADPEILMADEPTTALDVTIQAQILEIMKEMRARIGTAILLVTHDLAVIAEVADRVAVMYAGQIVEMAPVKDLFTHPLHPYTQGLLASIPRLDQPSKNLTSIPGSVPNLIHPPTGCRFHPRCPFAMPVCKETRPPTTAEGEGHTVACFLYTGPPAVE
jgi:peptide/nickel transport system ATP-binding protein